MRKWFRNFILRFIPPDAFTDEVILSKHKLFIAVSFITAFFAFGYGVMSYFINFNEGLLLMAIACIYFSMLPFLLKKKFSLTFLSNAAIAVIGLIYIFLSFYSGGIAAGPMDHWILLLPMLGMLLLNFHHALVWLCIAVTISIAFFYFDFLKINLPVKYSAEYYNLFNALSFIGIILILFLITSVFEVGKTDALKNLDMKNKELSEALKTLHETQAQLIQQEKLAALGKMTAGIAHEIENPLNFVNNFSELSSELIEEIKSAINEDEKNNILSDLKNYISKINHHGKTADNIVKGMLMHSKTGSGAKELTDINALCEQAITLSFHSFYAKIPGFMCEMEKKFAENISLVKIVPQDVSRMIINLLNNAFYAVRQKSEESSRSSEEYHPRVSFVTQSANNFIIVSIRDNGNGIAESVKSKIFEPFFTTKPRGLGTGLGLSLSYDIVKAHGGELKVNSKENEFTEFIVSLPVS